MYLFVYFVCYMFRDRVRGVGSLSCRVCGAAYSRPVSRLDEGIDVYGDWIDACVAANAEAAKEAKAKLERGLQPSPAPAAPAAAPAAAAPAAPAAGSGGAAAAASAGGERAAARNKQEREKELKALKSSRGTERQLKRQKETDTESEKESSSSSSSSESEAAEETKPPKKRLKSGIKDRDSGFEDKEEEIETAADGHDRDTEEFINKDKDKEIDAVKQQQNNQQQPDTSAAVGGLLERYRDEGEETEEEGEGDTNLFNDDE